MVRWILAAALIAACMPRTAHYTNSDPEAPSSWELPALLPRNNFVGRLTDPYGQKIEVPFEAVFLKGATCYWSRTISLCTGNGAQVAASEVGPGGLRVRVEVGKSGEYTYYVFGGSSGIADYSVVKRGKIIEFGVMNLGTGQMHSRYKLP